MKQDASPWLHNRANPFVDVKLQLKIFELADACEQLRVLLPYVCVVVDCACSVQFHFGTILLL